MYHSDFPPREHASKLLDDAMGMGADRCSSFGGLRPPTIDSETGLKCLQSQTKLEASHGALVGPDGPVAQVTATDRKLEKRALRKVDLCLTPMVFIIQVLSFVDRMNIGNVKILGMQHDVGFSDVQYSMALTVTFIPYVLVEIPSNLLSHKIGAGIHIPGLVCAWGLITCFHSVLRNTEGLLAARFFLGLVEGGLYPGVVLYLSSFYLRSELQLRMGLFHSATSVSGAFAGLMAYGINELGGNANLKGWAWVFLLEGIITVCIGCLGLLLMPSTPADIRFLTTEERSLILARLARDRGPRPSLGLPEADQRKPSTTTAFQVASAFKSPHVLLICFAQFFCGINTYSVAYFLPTIVKTFGYSATRTQLMTVPPYMVGVVYILTTSYLADKYRKRAMVAISSASLQAVGFLMLHFAQDMRFRYGSVYFAIPGVFGVLPALSGWLAQNSEPYRRRAVSIALGPVIGNLGGLLSIWLFAYADKTRYTTPTIMNIVGALVIITCSFLALLWMVKAEHDKVKQREKILEQFQLPPGAQKDLLAQRKLYNDGWEYLGDQHPDFKYSF